MNVINAGENRHHEEIVQQLDIEKELRRQLRLKKVKKDLMIRLVFFSYNLFLTLIYVFLIITVNTSPLGSCLAVEYVSFPMFKYSPYGKGDTGPK